VKCIVAADWIEEACGSMQTTETLVGKNPCTHAVDMMAEWFDIAAESDCPPGSSIECVAGDRMVALANVDGVYHAIDGLCPHQGGPLGTGVLCNEILTCPWHGWQFDVTSGRHRYSQTVRQQVYEVRCEAGRILVRPRQLPAAGTGVSSA